MPVNPTLSPPPDRVKPGKLSKFFYDLIAVIYLLLIIPLASSLGDSLVWVFNQASLFVLLRMLVELLNFVSFLVSPVLIWSNYDKGLYDRAGLFLCLPIATVCVTGLILFCILRAGVAR